MAGILWRMSTETLGTANATEQRVEPWIPDDSTFGARLALVRWRMGWNMKEAARACGEPAATWRTWEVDGVMPRRTTHTVRKIAAQSGCDYGWLLDGRTLARRGDSVYYATPADRPRDNRPAGGPGRGPSGRDRGDTLRRPERTRGPAPMARSRPRA